MIPAPRSTFLFLSLHHLHCIPPWEWNSHFIFALMASRHARVRPPAVLPISENKVYFTTTTKNTTNGCNRVRSDNALQTPFKQSTDKEVWRVFPLHRKDSEATDHKHGTLSEIWGDFPAVLLLVEQRRLKWDWNIFVMYTHRHKTGNPLVWSTTSPLKVHELKDTAFIWEIEYHCIGVIYWGHTKKMYHGFHWNIIQHSHF